MDNGIHLEEILKETVGDIPAWEERGFIPREAWRKFGESGIIGISTTADSGARLFSEVCSRMLEAKNVGLMGSYAINEIACRLLNTLKNEKQESVLAEIREGQKNVSLCITEKKAGSDVSAIETEAVFTDGFYSLNGKKVLVSNGPIADYFVVAAKTNKETAAWRGISLFLIRRQDPGVEVSRNMPKAGANLMPIGEMELSNCRVSEDRLLGRKNRGFEYLMNALGFERMVISILAVSICEVIFREMIPYLEKREIFGNKLRDYQNTKFVMANYYSRIKIIRSFVDQLIADFDRGITDKTNITIAKINATELLKEFTCAALQLYGASGFLSKHWISNLYNDIRWTAVAGGANELLLDILGNNLVHGGK